MNRCKDCWYVRMEIWNDMVIKAECRRHSPVYQETSSMVHRMWPVVDPDHDWCGDFEQRSEAA